MERKTEPVKLASKEETEEETPLKEPDAANLSPIFISRRARNQRRILDGGSKADYKSLSSTEKTRASKESVLTSLSEDTPGTDYPSIQPPKISTDHMF
ncbi:hypothetical protein OESDEN_07998 [Oesophagostomum dentatum]|uniref:Uncharacterized protein n=1 Tax=Oesophagostomum dentatum TaxID=61180 RepID=A0A0B1T8M3_OESDE|nr:hypothetical protein OESDEN_07998 [Oesophagostomum dentatum]